MLIDTMFARDMYQVYEINDDWWLIEECMVACHLLHYKITLRIIAMLQGHLTERTNERLSWLTLNIHAC